MVVSETNWPQVSVVKGYHQTTENTSSNTDCAAKLATNTKTDVNFSREFSPKTSKHVIQ